MIGVTAGTIYHRELASDALSVAVTLAKGHQDGRETEEFRIQVSPSKRKKNSKGAPKPAAPEAREEACICAFQGQGDGEFGR